MTQPRIAAKMVLSGLLMTAGMMTAGVAQNTKSTSEATVSGEEAEEKPYVQKTQKELKTLLSNLQYRVTQSEGTEPAASFAMDFGADRP